MTHFDAPVPRRIAVAGGTGAVGRHVVDLARSRGHDVVVLSRATGVDLLTAQGLTTALAGADVVVDVSSRTTQDAAEAQQFFGTVTRHLLEAEAMAGVGHHVALSVVGADAAPYGYYAGKVLQERLVAEADVLWTLLRATQFHEFAAQVYGAVRLGPLVLAPRMRSQPVAAREVAQRLVDLAEGEPSGRVADLGGPREESVPAMVRGWARATGRRGPVLGVPLPGKLGRAMRDGSLLAREGADHGVETFSSWLDRSRTG